MAKKIGLEEIKKGVKSLVSEIAEIPEEGIKDDARFAEDLGIDSMVALEIVAAIEKKYKVIVPEEKIPSIRSLNNVYELLDGLLNK